LGLSQEGLEKFLPLRPYVDKVEDPSTVALFWESIRELGDAGRLAKADLLVAEDHAKSALRAAGQRRRVYKSLYNEGWLLQRTGQADDAVAIHSEMQRIELAADPLWLRSLGLNLQVAILVVRGQFEAAVEILGEQRSLLLRSPGEEASLTTCQDNLCAALNCLRRFAETSELASSAVRSAGPQQRAKLGYMMFQLMHAQTFLGRLDDAEQTLRQAMPGWRREGMLLFGLAHVATYLAERGRFADAARLDGAAMAYVLRSGLTPAPVRRIAREHMLASLDAAIADRTALARWKAEGETLDEEAIAALCLEH
jgi:tetratricopeptide (TPR) repeat protein